MNYTNGIHTSSEHTAKLTTMKSILIALAALALVAAATALGLSTGVANARPFCYETGPGYQKCLDSPSGDYFNPIYQGPSYNNPWGPNYGGGY